MMKEAVTQDRMALEFLRLEMGEKFASHSKQSSSLMESAFKCASETDMRPETIAPFNKAKDEWRNQRLVLEAATAAYLRSKGIDPKELGLDR
jgi:hypothetical protein